MLLSFKLGNKFISQFTYKKLDLLINFSTTFYIESSNFFNLLHIVLKDIRRNKKINLFFNFMSFECTKKKKNKSVIYYCDS